MAGGGTRQVKLERECELRIEVGNDTSLKLRLLNGTAEIFGTELPPEIWLTFPPRLKFAVFTWYGATVELDGNTETDYTADETPNISYVNVHAVLDARRNRAKTTPSDDPNSPQAQGPRVIVVGPRDSGKSTLSRMLLSWAAKQGWKPTFVDLDIGQGAITIPGCIAATPIEMPIDPVEGIPLQSRPWGGQGGAAAQGPRPAKGPFFFPSSGTFFIYKMIDISVNKLGVWLSWFRRRFCLMRQQGPNFFLAPGPSKHWTGPVPLDMPLVYYYGHTTPVSNVDLYRVLVKELSVMVEKQFTGSTEARAAGMVINTMGWIEGAGYELLLHAIDTFNANVVLVLGQEKLCSMLRDVLKNKPNVDVVKLQKSGGVVSRNVKFRKKSRSHRIREYFYGLGNDLSPHSNIANFSDLSIFRVGGGPQAPRSALPIGAEPAADPTRVVPVNINRDLLHMVLAISYASEPIEIISSNVAGFVYVTDINIKRKTLTYLAPSAGELPGKFLIVGTLTWLET